MSSSFNQQNDDPPAVQLPLLQTTLEHCAVESQSETQKIRELRKKERQERQNAKKQIKPGFCEQFIPKKQRYCKFVVVKGTKFCICHQDPSSVPSDACLNQNQNLNASVDESEKKADITITEETEKRKEVRIRIPCPLDPNHTVYQDQLQKHLLKCSKLVQNNFILSQPCYNKGCNLMPLEANPGQDPEEVDICPEVPPNGIPVELQAGQPIIESHAPAPKVVMSPEDFQYWDPIMETLFDLAVEEMQSWSSCSSDFAFPSSGEISSSSSLLLRSGDLMFETLQKSRVASESIVDEVDKRISASGGNKQNKHHEQNKRLLTAFYQFGLIDAGLETNPGKEIKSVGGSGNDTTSEAPIYLEYGSGKGGLSRWLAVSHGIASNLEITKQPKEQENAAAKGENKVCPTIERESRTQQPSFLLIERESRRHKAEAKSDIADHVKEDIIRLRLDLADFDLVFFEVIFTFTLY